MTTESIKKLQQDLIKFQTVVARENVNETDGENWECEEVEEIQNTINLLDNYLK